MPPKPKFTKEEVVAAALALVSEKGMEALTARELGARLGSSARPVFTVFNSMEEVQEAVRSAALKRFESYAEKAMSYTPVFKQVGMQMILFAREEPKLYQLLYMSENSGVKDFEGIFDRLGDVAGLCVDVIRRDYGLPEADAKKLFEHVWIHTFGIGALCATGMCRFSQEEIIQMLGQDFMAMLLYAKSGRMHMPTPVPSIAEAGPCDIPLACPMMNVIDFFQAEQKETLIGKIAEGDWSAARFLAKLLRENRFHQTLGDGTVYLLMDGQNIVSFVTLTHQDCIADEALYPWLGFFFTFPEYRGHRYGGKLLALAAEEARKRGCQKVYLATDHIGLYEKYGFTYLENRIDVYGEDSRIYVKTL